MKVRSVIFGMILVMFVGCSSAPSDNDIKGCVANIQGIEEFGEKYAIGVQTVVLNDVSIDNVISKDDGTYDAHVSLSISTGVNEPCVPCDIDNDAKCAEDVKILNTTFTMMGASYDYKTCMKTISLSTVYNFSDGSKGWSCSGQKLF